MAHWLVKLRRRTPMEARVEVEAGDVEEAIHKAWALQPDGYPFGDDEGKYEEVHELPTAVAR
jgi:hypothetical protein